MKYIKCERKITDVIRYAVNYKGAHGELLISDQCFSCESQIPKCKNCYGKIAVLILDKYNSEIQQFEKQIIIRRDYFSIDKNGAVTKHFEASNIFKDCEIIRQMSIDEKESIGKMTGYWRAADRSPTWKTDCLECRNKYKITPCQDIENNRNNGKPDNFCAEQKQRIILF